MNLVIFRLNDPQPTKIANEIEPHYQNERRPFKLNKNMANELLPNESGQFHVLFLDYLNVQVHETMNLDA